MTTKTSAVGAALVAALVGCSSTQPSIVASPSASQPGRTNVTAVTNGPPGQAQVLIGGKNASPGGALDCSTGSGLTTITIGEGAQGAIIVLTDQAAPTVKSIGIGDLGGVSLGYTEGQPGPAPQAARNGNSYTITGSTTGTDTADPTKLVDTTYEISATCP
jgi:ipoprotein LpqH